MNKSQSKYFNTAVKMNTALIELLEKKDFEYISVTEICRRAGVNRSTFYLHYDNTRDLLEETAQRAVEDCFGSIPANMRDMKKRINGPELEKLNFVRAEFVRPYLEFLKKNRRIFLVAVSNVKTFGLDEVYKRLFGEVFDPILDRFDYPEEERQYVMAFYLNGINAIAVKWLEGGCLEDMDTLCAVIQKCVFGAGGNFNLSLSRIGK
ncbi:MAG: TetR/AcrR family transcriptional regulator [Clostridia bacterium]|nr:TetR/AcrR family transcriptional regulator [Clostridia bacterium]